MHYLLVNLFPSDLPKVILVPLTQWVSETEQRLVTCNRKGLKDKKSHNIKEQPIDHSNTHFWKETGIIHF